LLAHVTRHGSTLTQEVGLPAALRAIMKLLAATSSTHRAFRGQQPTLLVEQVCSRSQQLR
jgi:hypothetical protein